MMNATNMPEIQNDQDPEVSWWCRSGLKAAAAISGGICFLLGIWSAITIKPVCIVAGVIQIFLAFIVLIFEVPFCCQYFRYTQPISNFASQQSYLRKAFIFSGLALIPVVLCFSMTTLFGCGLVFAVGVIHGLMALGKKADRTTMLARASSYSDKEFIVPNIHLQPN